MTFSVTEHNLSKTPSTLNQKEPFTLERCTMCEDKGKDSSTLENGQEEIVHKNNLSALSKPKQFFTRIWVSFFLFTFVVQKCKIINKQL